MCITRIDNLIMNLKAWPIPFEQTRAHARMRHTHTQREERDRERGEKRTMRWWAKLGGLAGIYHPCPFSMAPCGKKKKIKKTNTKQHFIALFIQSQIITM